MAIEVQEKYMELLPKGHNYDDDDDSDDSDYETFYTVGKVKNKAVEDEKTRKKRKKIEEFKVSKKRVTRIITCGNCHQPGHNRRNCPLLKDSVNESEVPNETQSSSSGLTQTMDELEFTFTDGIDEIEQSQNNPIEPPIVRTFKTRKQLEDEMDQKAKRVKLKKSRRTL